MGMDILRKDAPTALMMAESMSKPAMSTNMLTFNWQLGIMAMATTLPNTYLRVCSKADQLFSSSTESLMLKSSKRPTMDHGVPVCASGKLV